MAVVIDFDERSRGLVISGGLESLGRSQLFAAFLRKHGGEFQSEQSAVVPCSDADLASVYRTLEKILERVGISVGEADGLSKSMQAVRDDEEHFEEFSRLAEAIRRGDVESEGFEAFARTISETCPGRSLYPLQLLSAYHLAFSQHCCNFSVPGSGKTTIVLAAYAFLNAQVAKHRHVDHLLVIGPLSSFRAWEEEFNALFGREPRTKRISGIVPAHERHAYLRGRRYAERNVEMTLTSYQSFMGAEGDFRDFLHSPGRHVMMVLDEAHYVKREDGEWAAAVLRTAPLAASRVVLTGTPVPNGYEDLHNLFRFIHPDRNIIGFPLGTLRAMTAGHLPTAVENLKESVRPFFTRIKKRDLGLAPTSEARVVVPMGAEQRSIYRDIEQLIVPRIRDDVDSRTSTLLRARLIRLRQAATNPSLLLGPLDADGIFESGDRSPVSGAEVAIAQRVEGFDSAMHLRKLEEVRRLVTEVVRREGKVVVWSYFLGNLALLQRELSSCAEVVNVISGATPIADSDVEEASGLQSRERIIHQFNTTPQTAVLIANPQAVGESISLHKAADTAIYFDRDFNAAKFIQSKDRIHRYDPDGGSPKMYYYIVSEDTVEQIIDERLVIKEERMAELIDTDDIPLFDIAFSDDESMEDIQAVIRAYEHRKAS